MECIEFVQDRPLNDLRYPMDTSKLHALGWNPLVSWDEGLQKTSRFPDFPLIICKQHRGVAKVGRSYCSQRYFFGGRHISCRGGKIEKIIGWANCKVQKNWFRIANCYTIGGFGYSNGKMTLSMFILSS